MSENDLNRVIIEENLKADHRDAKDEELIEKMMQTIKKCFSNVPHAWQDVSRENLVRELRSLLRGKG